MTSEEIKKLDEESFMPTYGRFDAVLCSGKNATGVGCDGKEYIDFGSGIGVNSLGWADEGWVNAVSKQAATLQHTSNLYYNPASAVFASELLRVSGYGAVFLGNSGAETNECAIKLARKYSVEKYGKDRCEILTLQNSFHGRTVTTLAATGQDVFHNYFFPFTEGFAYAEPNMESVREHLTEHTCAVMIEFIQGEGGVLPLDPQFVTELAALCKEKNLLLLADEVQTGVGRTGTFYCCEQYGVRPDVLTSAKGLGGGLPIGACLCTKELGDVMGRSAHGSTFGANPVVCAGALEVIRRVSQPAFLDEVKEKGAYLRERLEKMKGVAQVRGMGMMLGVVPEKGTSAALAAACVENGLLILTAKSLLRLLPPLTITREEMDKGLAILEKVLAAAE